MAGTSQVLFMKGKLSIAILALSLAGTTQANDLDFAEKVSSLIDGTSSEPVMKNIKEDLSTRQSMRLSSKDIKTIEDQSTKFDAIKFEIKMKEQLLKKRQLEEKIKSLSENPLQPMVDELTKNLENRDRQFADQLEAEIKRVSSEYETSIAQYKSEIENLKDTINKLREDDSISIEEIEDQHKAELHAIEEEMKGKIFPIKIKGLNGNLSATIFYQNNIYTKKKGDFVENRFRLEHITPTSVTFSDGKDIMTVPVVTKDEAYVQTYKGSLKMIELTLENNSESDEEETSDEPVEMATEIMPQGFGGFPAPMSAEYM